MRIAEIYTSIQGEGRLTGTESIFVRASGCNLRCHFCDTPYASWNPEGEDWSVDQILDRILSMASPHVVLTGGEPLIFPELVPLTRALREQGRHITVETAGTVGLPVTCDLMSISPKTSHSAPSREEYPRWHARHEATRWAPDVVRELMTTYPYQLKFVAAEPADVDEIRQCLAELPAIPTDRLLVMPEGTTPDRLAQIASWLIPVCDAQGWTYCPRRQIEWFGLKRGT